MPQASASSPWPPCLAMPPAYSSALVCRLRLEESRPNPAYVDRGSNGRWYCHTRAYGKRAADSAVRPGRRLFRDQSLAAIAASMAPPGQDRANPANVMSGLMVGILLARPLASLVADACAGAAFMASARLL